MREPRPQGPSQPGKAQQAEAREDERGGHGNGGGGDGEAFLEDLQVSLLVEPVDRERLRAGGAFREPLAGRFRRKSLQPGDSGSAWGALARLE